MTPASSTQDTADMLKQEKDSWSPICKPGGKYYLTRNCSTIVAFAIGNKWKVYRL